MSKKKTMNQPVRCIVYLSTVGDLQHVNQREQRQMNYHRTFSTIINTLINVGFSIERMIEPLPTDEILEQYPDYKDLFHKPDFLLLKAKK